MKSITIINGRAVEIQKTAVGIKYKDRPLSGMEERYEAWKAEQRKEKMLRESITTWGYQKAPSGN
ncbi:hypothetical protein [Lactococcus sp. DD01]|uniref:hypothetical protein n=1 Tax=Lactococcus sp. DD01 TaxID=1776443 RepID=UPI0007763AE4|nr:hypothetical protein [Lactococcus sp. DD01]KXT61414.1 hypothetical protein LACDD01_01427 [Lactococcus sp. DD01]